MFRLLALVVVVSLAPMAASAAEIVRYRSQQWQARHIHDASKAKTISETLAKLGCEVKKSDHNGHMDVKYRCEKWQQLDLKSHKEAHQWEKWLKEYGFQTEHKH